MVFKNQKNSNFRVMLIVVLMAGIYGVLPARASAETLSEPASEGNSLRSVSALKPADSHTDEACSPNGGKMWANGPFEPVVASNVQQELSRMGINAIVEARSYGETDSCGTYEHRGIDFTITLADAGSTYQTSQQGLADDILPILVAFGKPNLGNAKLFSPQGELIPLNRPPISNQRSPIIQAMAAESLSTDTITKKVYVIVYDPLLDNGQKLSQYLNWNDHALITQQTIDLFKQATNNRMNYVVAETTIVTSGWPELIDGFSYTEAEYLAVLSNQQPHHEPTGVSYNKIVNSPEFDICGKLNRGEIDEVWIYNGPWFGFYESTLVGPGAYAFNSPPVGGTHNCNKLLPIMGPSPERSTNEAVHNFGHRTEATMTKVYGSWQQNSTSHNWNKFGLVKAQSPNYSYSGCGSTHYPPNATSDYNYTNSSSVLSNCADFANYPNLGDPLVVSQPVGCSAWGCLEIDYYRYWFGHLPSAAGCGPDNVANDWWRYFSNPALALNPSYACQPDIRFISGNVGVGIANLSYNDGGPKTVATDTSGNYFLMVPNHWSGTITPSKANTTFTPASRDYADVQSDLYNQNYIAERGAFYVNIATGNNSNSCTTVATPCRNIQEAINKATDGDVIKVAGGTYLFSTNISPNVVIINKNLSLSGGWNSDFSLQNGASTIDGANTNNGILAISGTVVVDNFIVQNSISSNSGAIYIVNGNFTLRKSTLRNNFATSNGAGIFLDNGALNIVNSTISGNTANGSGGGIYASNNGSASVSIQNSTIAYNTASSGGGISRTNGTYNITNTIIANNSSSISGPDCNGTIAIANFNIIENMSGCSITSGSNNLNVDPQIDSNLTGAMLVHMTLAGSPAINAGTASGCPSTDQQGVARPQGSSCDIGSIELFPDNTPTFTPTFTPTNTPTKTLTPTNTPTNTLTITPTSTFTPVPPNNPIYLSLTSNGTVGGVASADEDILFFNGSTWSLLFDGSDVGVASPDLFGFSMVDTDTILMAFSNAITVNDLVVTPQDIVRFDATSLGSITAGTFSMYLDGSDVGLDVAAEKLDSVSLLADGRVLISTTGNPSIPGLTGLSDEDILAFTPSTLGNNTSGTWALYFDGSDVGLSTTSDEDIDALDITSNGNIYLSTLGDFAVTGVSGFDEDVFVCVPTSLGSTTACNYFSVLYFDGSLWGLSANDVDAINLLSTGPLPTNTPTNTPAGPTITATNTLTQTLTPTATATNIVAPSLTPTQTPTPSNTPTHTNTPGGTDLIFSDSFESANLSAWTSSTIDLGDLSVSPSAALIGTQGMQAVIDDTNTIYVTDDQPNAESHYRARFYFDPNSILMTSGDTHFIFKGFVGTSTEVLRMEFRQSAGAYQLRASLLDDGTTWISTSWFAISDAPHALELDWQAASGVSANNGSLALWIDGTQQASLSGVDNETRRIDRARLGALTGIDAGTLGTYYFDAFESRRLNYVGP